MSAKRRLIGGALRDPRRQGIEPLRFARTAHARRCRVAACRVTGVAWKAGTLRANLLINVGSALVPLAVALFTVPVYIRHIGDARYGILSVVWVLLGYLGFLDFGLSRAAVRTLARLNDAPQEERARVLVTTLALNTGLGLAGSVVLALVSGYVVANVLSVPDAIKPEIVGALPWIVALFPIAMLGGVGIGTLESRERFLAANLLGTGGLAAGQVLAVLVAVFVSPSLRIVIPAAVTIRVISVIATLIVVWRQERPLSTRHIDRTKAKELFSFGSWLTVSGVISPLMTSLDQFVIGSLLSVSAVTFYAVPMGLIMRSQIFPSALIRTLFPRLSGLRAHEATALSARALAAMGFGYATLCVPAVLAAPAFFHYWVGADFAAKATPVACLLFIGAWVNALAFVPYELLQSQGRADITGKLHAIEVLPFIGVLWALTHAFGIEGAAMAWSLRCVVDALLLFWSSHLSSKELKIVFLPSGCVLGASLLASTIGHDLLIVVPTVALGLAAILALSLMLVADFRVSANRARIWLHDAGYHLLRGFGSRGASTTQGVRGRGF